MHFGGVVKRPLPWEGKVSYFPTHPLRTPRTRLSMKKEPRMMRG